MQTCTEQRRGRLPPISPGKHPNRALRVSLAEPRVKTQTRAPSPGLPGLAPSSTPSPAPRLALHATRHNSYLVSTHCLHRMVVRALQKWPHAGKTTATTAGAGEVPQGHLGACDRVLERSPILTPRR